MGFISETVKKSVLDMVVQVMNQNSRLLLTRNNSSTTAPNTIIVTAGKYLFRLVCLPTSGIDVQPRLISVVVAPFGSDNFTCSCWFLYLLTPIPSESEEH